MMLKFRHKVFLTLLFNSLLIVICMLLIARYFAMRNFEDYVNKMETERLQELAEVLGQEFRKDRSWTPVLADLGRWQEMLRMGPGRPPQGEVPGKPPFPPPPTPFLPDPQIDQKPEHRPPPPFGKPLPCPPGSLPGPGFGPPSGSERGPPPGPPPGPHAPPPHFSLFDAEKRPLTGTEPSAAEGYQLKSIVVDGQVVGWLGLRRHRRPTHPLDLEFLRLQSQTFYTIGGVAILLAILVTWVLSRHLLRPVKALAAATLALTSRRFDTRLEVRSRDEFGQLAAHFNDMAQALERYEQMRRQWMADISHELRTPLAILRGEIEAIQDGVREITPRALESLHFEVLHLSRIVQDLHELSLIESQAFGAEPTVVSPLDVLEESLKSFHHRFEQGNIRLEPLWAEMRQVAIMAEPHRLMQLFSNLLENTLRYVEAPGTLKIFPERTPGRLLLHFEDSGPGVPQEALERLFDRLYRVDQARSRAQGGSGLGLAICKSIMESLGGSIQASSAPTGGLRITLIFPVLSG